MTQPSLHATFDTSLIDLGTAGDSFSTTESMPSENDVQSNQHQVIPRTAVELDPMATDSSSFAEASTATATVSATYVPTASNSASWAASYDTAGDILQATDDLQLETLLPKLLSLVGPESPGVDVHIADLCCGTGRNTIKLCQLDPSGSTHRRVVLGIDASPEKLAVAEQKLSKLTAGREKTGTTFRLLQHDFLDPNVPDAAPILLDGMGHAHNALVAALALQYFPLTSFFATVRSLVRPGGVVLLTNAHPDLDSVIQMGAVDPDKSGQALNWVHGVEETAASARNAGFRVLEDVLERAVSEDMLSALGDGGRSWIGVKVWYGMLLVREG